MQVDNMHMNSSKWATAGRVPPLDLSAVTVCPPETERKWRQVELRAPTYEKRQQLMHNPNHTSIDSFGDIYLVHGADGLPIGEHILD